MMGIGVCVKNRRKSAKNSKLLLNLLKQSLNCVQFILKEFKFCRNARPLPLAGEKNSPFNFSVLKSLERFICRENKHEFPPRGGTNTALWGMKTWEKRKVELGHFYCQREGEI